MGPRHARIVGALAASAVRAAAPLLGCASSAPLSVADATTQPPSSDPPAARAARERLVARIAAKRPGVSAQVLDAIRAVPRHSFVDAPLERAYRDRPLPIGWGQTISQPSVVAIMTEALDVESHDRVLEIGTGSGYQAAVLSHLAAHVDTIEIIAPLADAARTRLAALGYTRIDVRTGDGYKGWPERAPYDRILLTAAPQVVPDALFEQLAGDGVLVAPVGEGATQRLARWRRREGRLIEEDLGRILFVPMLH
jgi:protein-L-isoaspartate(D-aspartate) O-methyltransferase